ncbi:MAG: alpha/beta hydrolase [Gammaproteobacteria bacterium]|nr:MAG: alpha/beta hydrolase [Gammaproteobacteria bacterium]
MQNAMDAKAMNALCVHGAGGGGWEWNIWRRTFRARGWRVSTPDLQPVAAGIAATRLADYAEQVAAQAREMSASVLIGASLGALLALKVASNTQTHALVLINPLPPADVAPGLTRRAYPDVVPWGSARSLDSTLRALPDGDDAARLYALRRWRDESGAVLRDACAGVSIIWPRCPILVLASECDEDVPAQTSHALAARCAAELHLLQGASHVGPLLGRVAQASAEFALRWLARVV